MCPNWLMTIGAASLKVSFSSDRKEIGASNCRPSEYTSRFEPQILEGLLSPGACNGTLHLQAPACSRSAWRLQVAGALLWEGPFETGIKLRAFPALREVTTRDLRPVYSR